MFGFMALGVVTAAVQSIFFSMSQSVVPIDLVFLLVVSLYIRSHPIWATMFFTSGLLTLDWLSGWATPGHLVAGFAGWIVFILIRKKILVAQTSVAILVSALVALIFTSTILFFWSGWSSLSLPDVRMNFQEYWLAALIRLVTTALLISVLSRRVVVLQNRYRS